MDPLASVGDLETAMGRSLTPEEEGRALGLLAAASETVASVTGRAYSPAESCTAVLWPRDGRVFLPRQPVVSVASVTDLDGNAVDFTHATGGRLVEVETTSPLRVTYTAGVAAAPDLERSVVCQMAARALSVDPGTSGMTSENIDGYSYTVGSSAVSGGVGLLPAEEAALRRARPRLRPPVSML